jgi:dipeptidase
MDFLVSTYGYASTGESFSIADRDELWYMELIGKGRFAKGAVWVARKVAFITSQK